MSCLPFMPLFSRLTKRKQICVQVTKETVWFDLKPGTVIDTNANYRGCSISAERFNALIREVNRLKQRLA